MPPSTPTAKRKPPFEIPADWEDITEKMVGSPVALIGGVPPAMRPKAEGKD